MTYSLKLHGRKSSKNLWGQVPLRASGVAKPLHSIRSMLGQLLPSGRWEETGKRWRTTQVIGPRKNKQKLDRKSVWNNLKYCKNLQASGFRDMAKKTQGNTPGQGEDQPWQSKSPGITVHAIDIFYKGKHLPCRKTVGNIICSKKIGALEIP